MCGTGFRLLQSLLLTEFLTALGSSASAGNETTVGIIQLCGFRSSDDSSSKISVDNRIVGGVSAEQHEFKWQISIQWSYRAAGHHVCGAAIIGQLWVLTAAHCTRDFRMQDLIFVAGDHRINTIEGTEQVLRAVQILEHEGYNSITQENDIALVRMESPFRFNPLTIAPVCLPQPNQVFTGSCVVSGWGKLQEGGSNSDLMQKVWLPIISDQECKTKLGALGYTGPLSDSMLCAGFPEGGQDACQGDSGGPFVCPGIGNLPMLVGIVSWGIGCARKDIPGVYTEVSHYVGWINKKIAENTHNIQSQKTSTGNAILFIDKRENGNKEDKNSSEEDDEEETKAIVNQDKIVTKKSTVAGATTSPTTVANSDTEGFHDLVEKEKIEGVSHEESPSQQNENLHHDIKEISSHADKPLQQDKLPLISLTQQQPGPSEKPLDLSYPETNIGVQRFVSITRDTAHQVPFYVLNSHPDYPWSDSSDEDSEDLDSYLYPYLFHHDESSEER